VLVDWHRRCGQGGDWFADRAPANLGLVVEAELAPLEAHAQLLGQPQVLAELAVHVVVKDPPARPAGGPAGQGRAA